MTRFGPVGLTIISALTLAACSRPNVATTSAAVPKTTPIPSRVIARAGSPLDGSPPLAAPDGPPADDWTTFAHDQLRTGYQPQTTGISKTTVGSLTLRWRYETGSSIQASPLVAGGRVYAATSSSAVYALDARSGTLVWKHDLPGVHIAMTPVLSDGLLFVADHVEGGDLMALDAATGKTVWHAAVPGGYRAEPVVANNMIFEGETGGDAPPCHHGGVYAFDERTGKRMWEWHVDPHPHEGGSVWSPISYHDGHLVFGTGNTCEGGVTTADALVALDTHGKLVWAYSASNSLTDSDIGGGTTILHGHALVTSKNGNLYDIDEKTGTLNWSTRIANFAGYGGVGTPSTDGKMVVASAGFTSDPTKNDPPGGALYGLDTHGNIRWKIKTKHPISGNAPITSGVVFTPLDESFVALDVATGKRLWTYPTSQYAYPSPAIVPSGVYFANTGGQIFAFSLARKHA